MIFDSKVWINDHAYIFEQENVLEIIRIFPSRAVFLTSLYLDYLIGGMNPSQFRISGAICLAMASTLLVVLSLLLFQLRSETKGITWKEIAVSLLIGLLFLVHPLQIYTVLYIWQRSGLMTCMFYFAALSLYLATRMGKISPRILGYSGVSLCFALGMLTKETMATLPVVLLLAEFALFRLDVKSLFKRALGIALICLPAVSAYLCCTFLLHSTGSVVPQDLAERYLADFNGSGVTVYELLLTEGRIIWFYVAMVVAPYVTGIHFMRAVEFSQSLWIPPTTALAWSAILFFLGYSIWSIRKAPFVSFCILFAIVNLIPESTLPMWMFFGYRPILAMFGIFFLFGMGLIAVLSRVESRFSKATLESIAALFSLALVCLFAAQTWIQADKWNPFAVWKAAYSELPSETGSADKKSYAMILLHYGDSLIRSGDFQEAEEVLQRGVRLSPNTAALYTNLGIVSAARGDVSESVRLYRKAIELDQRRSESHLNLGAALLELKDPEGAANAFRKAVELNPGSAKAHANLGIAALMLGNTGEARQHLSLAVQKDPSLALAHSRLGRAHELSGDLASAAKSYARALALHGNLTEAHYNFARIAAKTGQYDLAEQHYETTLKLNPRFPAAYYELGQVFMLCSEFCKAVECFQKCLQIQPDFTPAKDRLESARKSCRENK
ncbi:Tfp pilus assembly protein PilF [Desulfomonile tiedjei DSM 6799]|uniref:Tfp pilus assembly protein PilF n=2 Tax=Desulfomonile tiedjei TaxID=2358 RepID=I4C551_DESTA|nr:Tfp pilus assembly protein PilF [Desulfomonile tiedjei DSM 6799]